MKKPKVSIVIPVYNGEKYVKQAIDSAINQTYDNIEIIVVNDGSKDKTEEICKTYGDKINYIKKENGGVSTALNVALKHMTGEYFSWLSHDDIYYPNKIEEQIKEIEQKTIILSDYDLIDNKGKLITTIKQNTELINCHFEYAVLLGLINGISLLIPKEVFIEVGNFDENLRCTQDYDLWFKILLKGYKFKHINKVLVASRQHSKQVTNKSPLVLTEGNKLWIDIMSNFPKRKKIEVCLTEYNFYKEMSEFLINTPYELAYKFSLKQMDKLKNINLNTKKYKISVLIIHNGKYDDLENSIESILNQTHKNIEIIILDNFTDIKSIIENKYNRSIKYYNFENKNNSYIKNYGVKMSTGSYISFLESGETYKKEKLEIQLTEMLLTNIDFSHTSYEYNGKKINSGKQTGLIIKELINKCEINNSTIMIKKDFVLKENIKYLEDIKYGEDNCLYLNIALKSRILGINQSLTAVKCLKNKDNKIKEEIKSYVLSNPKLKEYKEELKKSSNDKIDNNTNTRSLIKKTIRSIKNEGLKMTIRNIKTYFRKNKK